MSQNAFERLAGALDRLPNRYPRTETGVEIRLLEQIFSREEACLASQLCGTPEPVDEIAERMGVPVADVRARLMRMVRRGLIWLIKVEGKVRFRLAPFVVGIYEAQLENMDEELASLFEQYMANGGATDVLGAPGPPLQRVVPAEEAVDAEWILPYDDVRAIVMKAETFHLTDCICRLQREKMGHDCDFPMRTCLSFSNVKRAPREDDISKEEALALLDRAAELGLVHTVSNSQEVGYVCNCCGCCCALLRGITEWGIEHSVAYANYFAVVNAEKCTGCGRCVVRCQVDAITIEDGMPVISRDKCIGCGVCVTGCQQDAMHLQPKPKSEIVDPPVDYATWEGEREAARGSEA
jgi:H+/Na+-translocating ferredoxin:NAD+ oxidoreductase subunit B